MDLDLLDVAKMAVGFIDQGDPTAARAALKGAIDGANRERRNRGEQERERQGTVLRDVALERAPYRDTPPEAPRTPSAAGKRGGEKRAALERQRRQRALAAWSPSALLYLPNTVALFLRDHPMWESWTWGATRECNVQLVHCVPQLYQEDPLPKDERLALPLAVTGLTLWRALDPLITGPLRHVSRKARGDVLHAVYQEIRDGLTILERLDGNAWAMDDLAPEFREDFTAAVMAAEDALMHFVYIGHESWRLIRACRMGRDCLLGAPFYVNELKPESKDPHSRCRVGRHRKGREVTAKRR
jgi:hypothetical protein